MPRPTANTAYSVHPSVPYAQAIIANLPAKTGHSLAEWTALLNRDTAGDAKARRDWLKATRGIGGTPARMIAQASVGQGSEGWDSDAYLAAAAGYVETMYEGKESLRPLFDALVKMARSLGADIRICPCTTIVPLYRTHVFGEIKPTTKTRVDLGLALRGVDGPLPENLIDTGGLAKKDRITHRFALSSVDDIDGDVREWLGVAYGLDG